MAIEVQRPSDAVNVSSAPGASDAGAQRRLVIGVVNNMPDSALVGTESQFTRLLTDSSAKHDVVIRFSSLDEVERGESAKERIANSYWPLERLLAEGVDSLIVTGSEPRAARVDQEPYWSAMTRLLDWADAELSTSLWSCLAAHVAVRHLDGIERYRLADKCSGVNEYGVRSPGDLVDGDRKIIRTPHSRWNEIRESDLVSNGYRVLTSSEEGAVDIFVGQRNSFLVFCQGHPEYLADTLLREYRRDVVRFLNGERADFPRAPVGYFGEAGQRIASEFECRVRTSPGQITTGEFPFEALAEHILRDWFEDATMIYRNWLQYISKNRPSQRPRIG